MTPKTWIPCGHGIEPGGDDPHVVPSAPPELATAAARGKVRAAPFQQRLTFVELQTLNTWSGATIRRLVSRCSVPSPGRASVLSGK